MMDISRNQYFLAGLVLLFLGIQFRLVDTCVLTPESTDFLARQTGHPVATVNAVSQSLTASEESTISKEFRPPEWLGWALGSMGVVLILHSWAMKKPDH